MKKILLSNKQAGFSLVELSIIITIASILAAGYLAWTVPDQQYDAEKAVQTKKNIEAISEALEKFYVTNQRLPCPSIPTLNSNSGPQSASNTDTTIFRSWDDEGFLWNNGIYTCPSPLGGVPTLALGLPSAQMFDGWGRRLLYHVNPSLCNSAGCTPNSYKTGSASVTQSSATSSLAVEASTSATTPITTTAAYVLLSFGANGLGGYLPSGQQIATTGSSADEAENNDGAVSSQTTGGTTTNVTYVKHSYDSSVDDYFDDLVSFMTIPQVNSMAQQQTPVDYTTCTNNSSQLAAMTSTTATTLKTYVTSLQITNSSSNPTTYTTSATTTPTSSSYVYNTGDQVALEIMWDLQEACYALYGSSISRTCPAGQSYDTFTNSCTCAKGAWTSGGC